MGIFVSPLCILQERNYMRAELLAPAGSFEGLQAVVKAGADAVYIGGSMFGARAYAKNPRKEEMLEAIDYAHIHGKQVYLTVNTLLKNQELYRQLYEFLAPYYEQGVDAVIVQDLGVLSFLKKEFPELAIHASTQMAITGPKSAGLLKEAGASRIVTARELSLEEIHRIYQETGVEIESFVHGALCYCYSGMCLFSSMLGGRSGNRGRCAQPCRLPYTALEKGKAVSGTEPSYLLSPKDMCTVDILPEILQAGVYSLKIEGRMKKPEYAAGVTAIYRKYLDLYLRTGQAYEVEKADRQELLDLYQRDGFHKGYYYMHNGPEMMATVNEKEQSRKQGTVGKRNEALFARLKKQYLDTKKQEKINGNLILFADTPAILDLDFQDIHVQVQGDLVERAQKRPLLAERVRQQMEKTGQTPFVFDSLEILTDEAGFLPMQSLNELRRRGLEELQQQYLAGYRRTLRKPETEQKPSLAKEKRAQAEAVKFYVSVEKREQWETALKQREVTGIFCSMSMFKRKEFLKEVLWAAEETHRAGKEFYLALPYMLREGRMDGMEREITQIAEKTEGFLVRNLEELGYLKKLGLLFKAVTDYSVYSFNDLAEEFLENLQVKRTTVPLELNSSEIRHRRHENSEMIVYGFYPMMVSAQCVKKTCGCCDHKSGELQIKDRYGQQFTTKCFCDFCYNVIYNSVPTGLLEEAEQIRDMGFLALRMNFTSEGPERMKELLNAFAAAYLAEENKGKKKDAFQISGVTKGHFKRGVE